MVSAAFASWRSRMREPAALSMSVTEHRRLTELFAKLTAEPVDVRYEQVDAGGIPALWAVPFGPIAPGVGLYLHGGGFIAGSLSSHRKLSGHVASRTGRRVLLIDYRLAPEHPFPSALLDAHNALGWLRNAVGPDPVFLVGDSAGAGLAVSLMAFLNARLEPMPAAAVLFSPWTDLTRARRDLQRVSDPMVAEETLDHMAALYLDGHPGTDPYASPAFARLGGLPSLLIQVGEHERLLDDSRRLAEGAREQGVDAELEVWPDMVHVFQMGAGNIPEADASLTRVAAWLNGALSAVTTK